MKTSKLAWIAAILCVAFLLGVLATPGLPVDASASSLAAWLRGSGDLYARELLNGEDILDISITLQDTDLDAMKTSPMNETYYEADVTIGGMTVTDVGIRTKGNSSLKQVAGSDSDRFSLKVDFNRYVSGQDLLGLTMLNLNNCMADPSYMREFLSYEILREAGVPVPAYTYANVYINGRHWGFYLAVEGVADAFLERWYGTSDGALYKPEGVGADLVYRSDDPAFYTGMTLESEPAYDYGGRMVAMLKALKEGTDLDKYLDVDEVLRYLAANTVLISLDGYQGTMLHNYYLYELNGRFSILPWDYNMSMAGFNAIVSADGGYLYIDTPVAGTTMEARPLVNALLSNEEYLETYRGYLRDLSEGVFSVDAMRTRIAGLTAMIDADVKADPTSFFTYEQFQKAVDLKAPASAAAAATDKPVVNVKPNPGAVIPGGIAPGGVVPGGAGGIMGGNAVPLMSFVRMWNASLTAQLDGTSPSTGTVAGGMGGNRGGAIPGGALPDGRVRPDGGAIPGGVIPDGGRVLPGGIPNDGVTQNESPAGLHTTSSPSADLSPAEIALLASAALIMAGAILLLKHRRSLHSI